MSKYKLSHQEKQLKEFINSFDFTDPSWDSLPHNFPHIPKSSLTKDEIGILTGITLAWYNEKGRDIIYDRCIKVCFTITFTIIVGLYARFITSGQTITAVKNVSAATVSATLNRLNIPTNGEMDEFIESTMSAIRKTNYSDKNGE